MSPKKCGVTVDCRCCGYTSSVRHDRFEVAVLLCDTETGTKGTATLLCTVSSGCHEVELKEWKDAEGHAIQPSTKTKQGVVTVLADLADQQICGNHQICPTEVVQIVDKLNRR